MKEHNKITIIEHNQQNHPHNMNAQNKIDKVDGLSKSALQGNILKALDGLKLQAIGCCMLAKIKSGKKYRIEASSTKVCKAVTFYTLRGKKPIVTHDAYSVLSSIQGRSNGYLNGFDLI